MPNEENNTPNSQVANIPNHNKNLKPVKINTMPEAPKSIWKLLGPSFIMLGLGLGTGELILWPYLVTNWGMGIIWGALLGITMQFFLNMEIERYALVNGESIFVGFARLFKYIPTWFILSTILAWSWPGFSAAAAQVLVPLIPFVELNPTYLAIGLLLLVGAILTLGPVLYKTVERFQMVLIAIGVPLIILIVVLMARSTHYVDLGKGLFGIGEGYMFFPPAKEGIDGKLIFFPLMSFLAALAYSGAGGNLMLAQSFYIKEKGYGMGKYAGKITSLITGKQENTDIEGSTFVANEEELKKYRGWWGIANKEHLIVFWGLGLFTMLLLALLGYATVYGNPDNSNSLQFIFNQAEVVSQTLGGAFGAILLIVTALMLFSTQLAVIDAAGRIVSENIAIIGRKRISGSQIPKIYYLSIWIVIIFGITVLLAGVNEPRQLIVTGAVLNAVCMFVFAGILNVTNVRLLPEGTHPGVFKQILIWLIFIILGLFSILVIGDKLFGLNLSSLIS